MTNRDMRTKQNKNHLGTAANRDAYEQQKSVIVKSNKDTSNAKDQKEAQKPVSDSLNK